MRLPVLIKTAGLEVALASLSLLHGSSASGPVLSRQAAVKLAPAIRAALRDSKAQAFIVQMREPVSPADFEALQGAGAHISRRYQRLPMACITMPGTDIPRLAALPAVTRISPDLQVKRTMEFASPAVGA